jgi:predicted pyridoxine 5'-phosphate oxidase superfamily flavin-nucleotide-binding protein
MQIPKGVINFFQNQGCVVVTTIDKNGFPHSACKGIVKIGPSGTIYLLDLYKGGTFKNLSLNPHISITTIDEHKFIGYSLKGKARIVSKKYIQPEIIQAWENKITSRLTRRVIRNIHEEKGHPRHPEALLPQPEYLIRMQAQELIDLTPSHLK